MTIHHQDQQAITNAVPTNLGGIEQTAEFARSQEVLVPLVQIGGFGMTACRPTTLYISPAGQPARHGAISLRLQDFHSGTLYKMRLL
jgi:hypothetical protein